MQARRGCAAQWCMRRAFLGCALVALTASSAELVGEAHGRGPYDLLPAGYNRGEVPILEGPDGAKKRPTVSLFVLAYDLPSPDCGSSRIDASLRIMMAWRDPRLSFDGQKRFPQHYWNNSDGQDGSLMDLPWDVAGKSHIQIDPDTIWTPDVDISERVTRMFCSDSLAAVFDDAFAKKYQYNVLWPRSCSTTTVCGCTLDNFPFDQTRCTLTFMPFTERIYKLEAVQWANIVYPKHLESLEYDYTFNIQSSFQLDRGSVLKYYRPKDQPGADQMVRYIWDIKRFSEYYVVNYLCPMLTLVALMWFTFFIPLDKSDRVAYGVTLLLTSMAVQLITAEKRPPEKEDTWLDLFQISSMVLIVVPVLVTVVLLRMSTFLERKVDSKELEETERAEYEEHIMKFIFSVDRAFRVMYPVIACVVFWILFTTDKFGDRNKPAELFQPLVMQLWALAFGPLLMSAMFCSCCNLISRGCDVDVVKWEFIMDLFSEDCPACFTSRMAEAQAGVSESIGHARQGARRIERMAHMQDSATSTDSEGEETSKA